jgi:hypothetical protein
MEEMKEEESVVIMIHDGLPEREVGLEGGPEMERADQMKRRKMMKEGRRR